MESCQRCKQHEVAIVSRKESFCTECFRNFVALKQRKSMMCDPYFQDIFKVMYADKVKSLEEAEEQNKQSRVLAAFSEGSSSLVMLHILSDLISEQKRAHKGKTGFVLEVVTCFHGETTPLDNAKRTIHQLKSFGSFRHNSGKIKFHILDLQAFYTGRKLLSFMANSEDFTTWAEHKAIPQDYTLDQLLDSCPDRSAKEDLLNIITIHTIKRYAHENNVKAVLWGHSMTRLADQTISLVAKGRGSQISSMMDTKSFDPLFNSRFKNLFPLKDVLLTEIDAYCLTNDLKQFAPGYTFQDTLLINKCIDTTPHETRLNKNMTIEEITRKYFMDIGGGYSNVISTVVRTVEKLDSPKPNSPPAVKCSICQNTIFVDPAKWSRAITVTSGKPAETEEELQLLQEWQHSNTNFRDDQNKTDDSREMPVCYGCTVLLKSGKKTGIVWPEANQEDDILSSTLKEFVLDSDED